MPLIQGQIQFLESSAGYATILGLHPQIGKFESPLTTTTIARYLGISNDLQGITLTIILGLEVKREILIIKDHEFISFCSKRRFMSNCHQLKNKSRNKSAYKGINIINTGYFF